MSEEVGALGQVGLLVVGGVLTAASGAISSWLSDRRQADRETKHRLAERAASREREGNAHLEKCYTLVLELITECQSNWFQSGAEFVNSPKLDELSYAASLVHDKRTREAVEDMIGALWRWTLLPDDWDKHSSGDMAEVFGLLSAARNIFAAALRGDEFPEYHGDRINRFATLTELPF